MRYMMHTSQSIFFLGVRAMSAAGTAPDNRLFVDAVLYRYRTGIPWRDLSAHFGSWKSTHQCFSRWCKSGAFDVWSRNEMARVDFEGSGVVRPFIADGLIGRSPF